MNDRRDNSGPPRLPCSRSSTEATRQSLIDAAEACFERYGVGKTTMQDVAKMIGVSRPIVYRHFDDREGLISAVVLRRTRATLEGAAKVIGQQDTLENQLVEGLLFLVEKGQQDPIIRILLAPKEDVSVNPIGARSLFRSLTHEMWEPVLHDARCRRELRPGLDFRAVTGWLSDLITLLLHHSPAEEGVSTHREMLQTFVVPALLPAATKRRC